MGIELEAPAARTREERRQTSWGLVWVAAGASLWGTDTVLRRPLTASLSSAQIVLIEHLILSAFLLPALWRARLRLRELRPVQWAAVLGIAWGGSALATVLFTEAVRIGNPTTAVLLQKSQPLFTTLLAWALLREELRRWFWISLGLALAGAYLVSFGWGLPAVRAETAAPLLALGAAAIWGSCTVLGRFALRSVSFGTLTALRIVAATPLLLALALAGRQPLQPVSPRQVLLLLAMALVPGLLALLIYYRGLSRSPAAPAAIAELSFPATATLLNWLVLGARIGAVQIAGFVLLWGAILSLQRRVR